MLIELPISIRTDIITYRNRDYQRKEVDPGRSAEGFRGEQPTPREPNLCRSPGRGTGFSRAGPTSALRNQCAISFARRDGWRIAREW